MLLVVIIVVVVIVVVTVVLVVVVVEVLGTIATGKYRFSSFKPADEANSTFRTLEIERLVAHKLFVATFSCHMSFTLSGVPIDFFLPKEIIPPCKQAHIQSLSSTDLSAQPQAFEIRENYHGAPDMSHTCHEEQIEDILNHLDELSLDHIKEMEGHVDDRVIIQQDFNKLRTELQEACAQIAGLQRKQMRHNDRISLARFRISTLELNIKDIQAFFIPIGLVNEFHQDKASSVKVTVANFTL
nr:hypothetical protein [Tanacetum cinerariifolium]